MYSPEEISMMLLRKLTEAAKKHFGGKDVKDVVITVPAYFSNAHGRCAERQCKALWFRMEPAAAIPCCRIIYVQQPGDDTYD